MCGIAGIAVKPNNTISDFAVRLAAMSEAMVHRGPDDDGVWLAADGRVGLATRRLAIRDLSPAGHMPMATCDGAVVITYNGEIYNADELRRALEQLGYVFQSASDTEVILLGYVAWGHDVVARLRGMFAFAIVDQRPSQEYPAGHLLLARDPMGVKPLYYAWTGEGLLFASEIKAILAAKLVGREVSSAGLVGYLLLGSVPNPWTIYRDIKALEPATYVEADLLQLERMRPTVYWNFPRGVADPGLSREQAVELVRERLLDAVRVRLVSDVPLGAFLSGGLDSSTVVALMRQATSGPLRTCSMVFEEAAYSEARYARAMAEAVGAEHFERVITANDLLNEFDHIIAALDQPSVDGVNTYFVSQTARQAGLTVALSGLGGDELFAGYDNTFRQVPQVYRAMKVAQSAGLLNSLAKTFLTKMPQAAQWQRITDALEQPATPASAYLTRRGLFAPSEVKQLVDADLFAEGYRALDLVHYISERGDNHAISDGGVSSNWISRTELRTYTHNQLLRDTDVMSMAHSLEVREPLLDVPLVEAVLGLPESFVAKQAYPKQLLNDAAGKYLPDVIRQRQNKVGFTFPFALWLAGPLAEHSRQTLKEIEQSGMLRPGATQQVYQSYTSGDTHWSRVWGLVAISACCLT